MIWQPESCRVTNFAWKGFQSPDQEVEATRSPPVHSPRESDRSQVFDARMNECCFAKQWLQLGSQLLCGSGPESVPSPLLMRGVAVSCQHSSPTRHPSRSQPNGAASQGWGDLFLCFILKTSSCPSQSNFSHYVYSLAGTDNYIAMEENLQDLNLNLSGLRTIPE